MPKQRSTKKIKSSSPSTPKSHTEFLADLEDLDMWDIEDPGDQRFWEEFFQLEELLAVSDELDPPTFSITVHNHQTGETRTHSQVRLRPSKEVLVC